MKQKLLYVTHLCNSHWLQQVGIKSHFQIQTCWLPFSLFTVSGRLKLKPFQKKLTRVWRDATCLETKWRPSLTAVICKTSECILISVTMIINYCLGYFILELVEIKDEKTKWSWDLWAGVQHIFPTTWKSGINSIPLKCMAMMISDC